MYFPSASGSDEVRTALAKEGEVEKRKAEASSKFKNGFQLAVMVLGDYETKLKVRQKTHMMGALADFHNKASRECRSAEGSAKFLAHMVNGGFFYHLIDTVKLLQNRSVLEFCGVRCGNFLSSVVRGSDDQLASPVVAMQNERAEHMAKWATHLCRRRLMRGLWLLEGWPVGTARFFDVDTRDEAFNTLKRTVKAAQELEKRTERYAVTMAKRSIWQTVPCEQLIAVCEESRWELTPEFLQWCRDRLQLCASSQVVEDQFQKLAKANTTQTNKRMAIERMWYALLKSNVLETVHKYKAPASMNTGTRGITSYPETFWAMNYNSQWHELRGVASAHRTPQWHPTTGNQRVQLLADCASAILPGTTTMGIGGQLLALCGAERLQRARPEPGLR